jgi:voltage-gated potassium channel
MPDRLLHFELIRRALGFYRRWISVVVLSAALLGVVGYASDETIGLFYISLAAVIFLVTIFHVVFGSRSAFFNVVFANIITIYLCFFTFFVESLFRGVGWGYIALGFLLPLVSFVAGAVRKRREITEIIESQQYVKEEEFARSFLWLIPIALVGVAAFILHMAYANAEDAPALADAAQQHLAGAFLMEMSAIALIVFFASRDFTLMLVDTGMLFSDFFVTNARLIKPAFAFFTFYSLNIIVFSAVYKIIDKLSDVHHFVIRGVAKHLSFVEAMYFSLVTVSTLGYGDIVPVTNPIRFIVGIQTFLGTMLFFFGVHAIIGHKGADRGGEAERPDVS